MAAIIIIINNIMLSFCLSMWSLEKYFILFQVNKQEYITSPPLYLKKTRISSRNTYQIFLTTSYFMANNCAQNCYYCYCHYYYDALIINNFTYEMRQSNSAYAAQKRKSKDNKVDNHRTLSCKANSLNKQLFIILISLPSSL